MRDILICFNGFDLCKRAVRLNFSDFTYFLIVFHLLSFLVNIFQKIF